MQQAFGISTLAVFLLFTLVVVVRYQAVCIEDRTLNVVERLGARGGDR
jgi:hypothetical protein